MSRLNELSAYFNKLLAEKEHESSEHISVERDKLLELLGEIDASVAVMAAHRISQNKRRQEN